MTDTLHEHADPTLHKGGDPLVQMIDVGKSHGAIRAPKGINLTVNAGEVTCVLGDDGADKSTLIKIISGLHPDNEGTLKVDGPALSPHHAYLVANHFVTLKLGQAVLDRKRSDVGLDELTREIAGGDELAELSQELQR
jgi:ABC-type polar amino acid transport system ATPase subunit